MCTAIKLSFESNYLVQDTDSVLISQIFGEHEHLNLASSSVPLLCSIKYVSRNACIEHLYH